MLARLSPEIRAVRRGSRHVPAFAHSTCALESGLGVRLGYERAFGVTSVVGGQELDTLAFAFEADR